MGSEMMIVIERRTVNDFGLTSFLIKGDFVNVLVVALLNKWKCK